MRTPLRSLAILAMLPAIAASGCGDPRIRLRPFRAHPVAFAAGGIGGATATDEAEFTRLEGEVERSPRPSPEALLALADMADRIGSRRIASDPPAATPWFRDAAAYATFALGLSGSPELRARSVARHNHAVEGLLRAAGSGPKRTNPAWREQLAATGVTILRTSPTEAALPCDELWIAADYRVSHLEPVARDGLGVPLVALSVIDDRLAVPDKFYPERLRLPATAVFRPGGPLLGGAWKARPAVLALHDPAHEASVPAGPGGSPIRLAGDLTTPLAHQVLVSPLKRLAVEGLLRPDMGNDLPGIVLGAPYQPGRIPVLFVHGLFSSPDAWLVMANALRADPEIRDRYQFWFAYYPTGSPVAISAARLRGALHDLRDAVDPGHADPALDRMVVVGHSLGGVLTRQLVQSSGRELERGLLTRPIERVAMSAPTREALSKLLYFEPEPSVARVVFLCAPHRGSNTANQLIGRVSSALVREREDARALHDEILALNGPEVFRPAYRRRPPNVIDNLAFDSPVLKAMSGLPMAPGVPYHTIAAAIVPSAPPERWTDGVVSFRSAHLDGAESEILIRHDHFSTGTPEAIAEVHRILRLHLNAASAIAAAP